MIKEGKNVIFIFNNNVRDESLQFFFFKSEERVCRYEASALYDSGVKLQQKVWVLYGSPDRREDSKIIQMKGASKFYLTTYNCRS